ncbi:ATP synthase F1 subunit epsilon [Sporomusa malonica]|uniref:ATP synthase, F1 epsilon subunit n=1 Tax=Sporomusa malonica TaxID=112901 RepID=A0A1W2EI33_9FIRM|nr:ATP synthase F1 subunit epsilon [Sporomusa malonica]SMD08996.1 ATP synthase, F1 epsilon subunit [Sporomusa malonica]
MSKTLRLEVMNPDHRVYEGQVSMVIVRATTGEMGILPGHAPLVALLDARPVRIRHEEGELQIPVNGGILLVKPDLVTILSAH